MGAIVNRTAEAVLKAEYDEGLRVARVITRCGMF